MQAVAAAKNYTERVAAVQKCGCVVGVADASFDVREGEVFCIIGMSGSGKSTLVRNLNRLIEPTVGEIHIGATDIRQLSIAQMRQLRAEKIGMVFQHDALLPHKSVLANVGLALELRGASRRRCHDAAMAALEKVELAEWAASYPEELSGGMQQRVGLARALAADPQILLLDEPFSALDPITRRSLQDEFLRLSRKMRKTTVFITHDLDEAMRLGDRIAVMRQGQIVQIGTSEQIVNNPANDYVSEFVAGVAGLGVASAAGVMEPLAADQQQVAEQWPSAGPDTPLRDLVDLSLRHASPIAIRTEKKVLGKVTEHSLLRCLRDNVS